MIKVDVDMKAIEGAKTFFKRYPGELKDAYTPESVPSEALAILTNRLAAFEERGEFDVDALDPGMREDLETLGYIH